MFLFNLPLEQIGIHRLGHDEDLGPAIEDLGPAIDDAGPRNLVRPFAVEKSSQNSPTSSYLSRPRSASKRSAGVFRSSDMRTYPCDVRTYPSDVHTFLHRVYARATLLLHPLFLIMKH